MLFPSGPLGSRIIFAFQRTTRWKLGNFKSHEYFLRFREQPLYDFDTWLCGADFRWLGL